jgi:hypothetical protein
MVIARPAMQQQQGGLLAQARAIGHEGRAFDVCEEANAGFDRDQHGGIGEGA